MNDKKIDEGGFVHSRIAFKKEYGHHGPSQRGITRRDWLAGLAMQGMLGNMEDASGPEMLEQFNAIPELAYRMADAMIAEGKKGMSRE